MKKGIFIAFEGGEGSGKTTIANRLFNQLKKEGYDCLYTREPGGVRIAEDIRNIILDKRNVDLDPKTEALLFAASRRQHLVEKVIPALNKGQIVISDRYIYSSIVYQGIGRKLGIKEVFNINKFAIDKYMPDLIILLDIDPEIGLMRANNRPEDNNRLDDETMEFHKMVNSGYLKVAKSDKTIAIVDASKSEDEVFHEVYEIVKKLLK
jgi:dTMP kinase